MLQSFEELAMRSLCLFICICSTVLAEREINCQPQEDLMACSFLNKLKNEEWSDDEKPCLNATLEMLHGVKNSSLWATWIWDSMQRPTGFFYGSRYQLGSFDQCMKPPWLNSHPQLRTQYCLADIHLSDTTPKKSKKAVDPYDTTEIYINTASRYETHFNVITWGVCFSSRCSSQTISKLVKVMLQTQHLPYNDANRINVHSCQIAGEVKEYDFAFKAFICALLLLVTAVVLSSHFLSYVKPETFLTRLAKCFCWKQNLKALMNTGTSDVMVLDGMKFFSSVLTISGHAITHVLPYFINGLDIEHDIEKIFFITVHMDVVVDTFFVISGLLLVQSIVKNKRSGISGLITMLWRRYVRLIGPQMLIVFYLAYVSSHVGSGPLWPGLNNLEAKDCAKNWWPKLLLIDIYVNTYDMCHPVTWYSSCDYTFAIIGTIFYYIYQKERRFGLIATVVIFLLSLLFPALTTYQNNLSALLFTIAKRTNVWKRGDQAFLYSYILPHYRANAFLIGMVLGHFMAVYNPVNYRKIIPMKWSLLGAFTALFLMERVLNLGAALVVKDYDPLEMATFAAFNRVLWAIAICGIIIFCEYGTVPIITNCLNFQLMVPMRRLSYGVYVIHMVVIYYMVDSIRSPLSYNVVQWIFTAICLVTISYIISFLSWHLIEAPLVNISNVLLDTLLLNKSTVRETKKEIETHADELTRTEANGRTKKTE